MTAADPVRGTAWQDRAACLYTDAEIFFPEAGRVDTAAHAKAICARCPVAVQCLAYAMDEQITDGIWGGLAAKERLKLRRMERAA